MMDLKFIREHIDEAYDILKKRNTSLDLEKILSLDAKYTSLIQKIQLLREERNKISKINTPDSHKRGKEIKEELKILEPELETANNELQANLMELPNSIDPKAPVGVGEEENVVLREHGQKPKMGFKPLDHLELGKKLNILDFEKGAIVSGSGFYYFKNEAVVLEFALIQFALEFLKKEGFQLFITPDLAKQKISEGIGFQPRGPETQIYNIENSDLSLIGTSEITLGGYHSGDILNENNLPLKYAGFSHCFRTEAGGYGRESRGLYRVHQFSKVEMFIYCLPSDSEKMLEYLVDLEEKIYKQLEIPYRIVDICSGDLGAPAFRKYDIEAWMPGRPPAGGWGEITSTSNCTDYQAKRLHIKYRKKDGTTEYVHTLNGTAIATSRLPIVILENFQQEESSIKIPKALQKYTGFDIIKPHAT